MRVSIIKARNIRELILPNVVEGSYWITDIDSSGIQRNLISIEADNGKWKLISNHDIYCISNQGRLDSVYLEEENFYNIKNSVENKTLLLYCSAMTNHYDYYNISPYMDQGILIGNSNRCLIQYQRLDREALFLKRVDNHFLLVDNQFPYGVYVNDVRVLGKKELKIGDVVFVLGMKFVYLSLEDQPNQFSYYLAISKLKSNFISVHLPKVALPKKELKEAVEDTEEVEYPLYDEKEYFHRTPRFVSTIEPLNVRVDPPPAKVDEKDKSLLLTIGPMITMSMTSMVMGYTALNNVLNGNATWSSAMPSLVICGAMFASVFIWPMFSKWYDKKMRIQQEKERQEKYQKYIESKKQEIIKAKEEQAGILTNLYPSSKTASEVILGKYTTLWERKIEDNDYLCVNLGIGSFPMKIDIKYPEDHFSMVEDYLKDMVSQLGKEKKMLSNVPIAFSFLEYFISGLIGEETIRQEYMKRILIQILAYHGYDNLKLIILTDEEHALEWNYLKELPHLFTDDRTLRFFATNNDEYKEVCYYLDKVFTTRVEKSGNADPKLTDYNQIYLIITDSFKKVREFDVMKHILDHKKNYGFSLLILDQKITNLPEQCTTFIQLNQTNGELHTSKNMNQPYFFEIDFKDTIDYDACVEKLANIPIEFDYNREGLLPNKLGFLEMYDVGKVEQLNSLSRWKTNNPMLNLSVPVGIGKNGEKISIDLHEKYHGPHGLIAGMTGSGKSEFIITYILSMAINYHPYEVQFILIDYKGGGLALAFQNQSLGLKLPHLVGTITNLDKNEIQRSLASIESELKRRQALFNEAREISKESTIDIYKYQRMYREHLVKEPVSHLFIISDEFAELKNQQPEFMDQLISTARIGRSLGVHLILATQKPSGVVDPQIWSNTRFRVCMRVQDKSDSNEVIKCPDAAYLKQTGRFYFQVGYNEIFVLGQAAWAGGKYVPANKVNKSLDTSIQFIDNIGYPTKTVETREKVVVSTPSNGEELLNLVKYLASLAEKEKIVTKPLWLDKIPTDLKLETLLKKYTHQKTPYQLEIIVGEYDVPKRQEQKEFIVPLYQGNVLLYGASGSGKENFLTTMIYSSFLEYTPEDVNYYIVDFGAETLKMFTSSPYVGDIVTSSDEEKVRNLFKMLDQTMEERKRLFSDYGGNYQEYCKNSQKPVPCIVVMINNYEAYQDEYGEFDDELIVLTRECTKYGIYFLITVNTPNGIRFKLRQNFSFIYSLQQNSEDDYTTILGNVHKTYPTKAFGRGIMKLDEIYEFQTAFVTDRDEISKVVKETCQSQKEQYQTKARSIPVLPEKVTYAMLKNERVNKHQIALGIDKNTLEPVRYSFIKNYATLISALELNTLHNFITMLVRQIDALGQEQVIVINAEDDTYDISSERVQYIDQKFNEIFESFTNFLQQEKDAFEKNNYDKSIFQGKKPFTIFIIGVDSFKNKLNADNKTKFGNLFTLGKDLGIVSFLLIDTIDKIKKIEFEPWYKSEVNNNFGIYLGNGISEQFSIKTTQKLDEMKKEVPDGFGFVIKRGRVQYVKFLEEFDEKKI